MGRAVPDRRDSLSPAQSAATHKSMRKQSRTSGGGTASARVPCAAETQSIHAALQHVVAGTWFGYAKRKTLAATGRNASGASSMELALVSSLSLKPKWLEPGKTFKTVWLLVDIDTCRRWPLRRSGFWRTQLRFTVDM